jgi:hypothetical protein
MSEGLPHCVSSPPRFPAEHSSSPSRCRERIGVSSAAPPASAPFESKWRLACRGGQGPRSGASREGERFSENQNAFHRVVVLAVREDRSSRPFGFGLRVTPPWVAPLSRVLARFLFIRVALQTGVPAPLLFTAPPRVRLRPDGPSTEERLGRSTMSRAVTPLSPPDRSALTASTIQQLAG